jgi:type 1 glutamine amidotransferase
MRLAALGLLSLTMAAVLQGQAAKRVLYVTASAGFRHGSIEVSREVMRVIAPGQIQVTATEDVSLLTAAGLRDYDALFFFTSGELALTAQQKQDILEFVRSGHGFGGVHSATDTLYTWPDYGEMIGGVFDGHPWVQEASIDVEDATHPISRALAPSWRLTEEFYQFRNFSRDRVRVLMTLDTRSVDLNAPGVNRTDKDFALAWVRNYGSGRVFYTALGHFDETWKDARFQGMLRNALLWLTGVIPGEASAPARGPVVAASPEVVAPGAALEIYGSAMTTGSTLVSDALDWKYRLAGTRVLVNGAEAPIYYASPGQLNVQFPMDLRAGTAMVLVNLGEKTFDVGIVPVMQAAPVIRATRVVEGAVEIYATGLGAVDGDIGTGTRAPLDRVIRTQGTPSVRIGGQAATVLFSGLAPGWVALYQVNAAAPAGVNPSNAEIELEMAGRISRIYPE